MRRLVLTLAFAVLAVPSAALGKEVQSISVCGTSGCTTSSDHAQVAPFIQMFENQPQAVLDAVPVSSFYKVGIKIRGDHAHGFSFTLFFVKPNLLRDVGRGDALTEPFHVIPPAFAGVLDSLASNVTPFPAPRVMHALIDQRTVAQPRPYIGLFAGLKSVDEQTDQPNKWIEIVLRPDVANPWFRPGVPLLYRPGSHTLILDRPARVGDGLARRIAHDAGIRYDQGGSGSWRKPVTIGLAVVCLPLATGLWFRRRRRGSA